MRTHSSLLLKKEISEGDLAQIIAKAKKGDADSLARLSEYIYARLYSYVYYRVNHKEDAEDITSEVVLKIIKALENQRGNFHAWIYRIAANAVIDFYRRRAVRSEVSLSDMRGEIADTTPHFSKQILTQKHLREALNHITDEQRQVILLRFIEEYDNEETAKIMGKSVGAVKVLQYRALRSLRKYFEKKGYK
jgi:RNA polymerase sigma-70 factor (ECF subfamily)